eukprot:CAMPEP_0194492204 /NCGR_PEP_ID=MMETSP0253-20130528/10841_1 /TAXON_ID=2966 /ORGANISM="Noctiluca scintillans" /LENGTH=131 /DNA_ID=CAMNT_0039333039 /DNA_START=50 /DNA_END=443 /DNA_ORIENTATION=-
MRAVGLFMTHVVVSVATTWTTYPEFHCGYFGGGATDLDGRYGLPGDLTLAQCEEACEALSTCTAIGYDVTNGGGVAIVFLTYTLRIALTPTSTGLWRCRLQRCDLGATSQVAFFPHSEGQRMNLGLGAPIR